MARIYMTGYAGSTKDESSLLAWSVWQRFDPEFARRLKAMMDASIDAGKPVGVGGGWRSSASQLAGFLDRHEPENDTDLKGSTYFPYTLPTARYGLPAGTLVEWWELLPGRAPMAPPGRSYHESTTRAGLCLAVDMVGDLTFCHANAGRFNLVHFGDINGEPWHFQPAEIPHSRRNYVAALHEPLKGPVPTAPTLKAPTRVIRLTDPYTKSVYVTALAKCLVAYGWYSAVQDTFGPNMENAWRQTQKRFGIPVTGVYDELGRVKLQQYINTHPVTA